MPANAFWSSSNSRGRSHHAPAACNDFHHLPAERRPFLFLAFLSYATALVLTQGCTEFLRGSIDAGSHFPAASVVFDEGDGTAALRDHFGSLPMSMLTSSP